MDAGLKIKELAGILGVPGDTVINWEVRGVEPKKAALGKVEKLLDILLKQN